MPAGGGRRSERAKKEKWGKEAKQKNVGDRGEMTGRGGGRGGVRRKKAGGSAQERAGRPKRGKGSRGGKGEARGKEKEWRKRTKRQRSETR